MPFALPWVAAAVSGRSASLEGSFFDFPIEAQLWQKKN
jgi:hypothetical protein